MTNLKDFSLIYPNEKIFIRFDQNIKLISAKQLTNTNLITEKHSPQKNPNIFFPQLQHH